MFGSELEVLGSELEVLGSELEVLGSELEVLSSELDVSRCLWISSVSVATFCSSTVAFKRFLFCFFSVLSFRCLFLVGFDFFLLFLDRSLGSDVFGGGLCAMCISGELPIVGFP